MRSRKNGDRIMFLKRKVSKTLKKLFNEEKIPVSKRNELAVLESGGKLIWVESFGVNAPFAVTEKTEKVAIIKIKEG
ncbi:MAG: tRNA lysidine(34) synthetase TilS [Clostridia bacterium]|nr:tRNA lysidine(34) synthetase TilS [Clostridia bacterium]